MTPLALWWIATAGHVVASSVWSARLEPPDASDDERLFAAALVAVGSLSLVLHVVAIATGLTLTRAVVGLVVWNAAALLLVRKTSTVSRNDKLRTLSNRVARGAAIAAIVAIVTTWILAASQNADITGIDAAHYHVPHAVNLALGASPFGLPATQHLYPMASSVLAAWFILPLGDGLLVDLTMALPFVLFVCALAVLVRQTTGVPGLAWATALTLALFTTKLFRATADMSADLLFTAGALALVASLIRPIVRRAVVGADFLLAGLASGLLVGAKTTGVVLAAATLLLAAVFLVGRLRGVGEIRSTLAGLVMAAIAAIGAGGIWLVRNWWLYGSPVAPNGLTLFGVSVFAGAPYSELMYYLSVLGDVQKNPHYPVVRRAIVYSREWLGAGFLTALWPALLVPIDLVLARFVRNRTGAAWQGELLSARLFLLTVLVAAGVALTGVLLGAPWTSLEWSKGLSLRFLLPIITMAALTAAIGLLPTTRPWFRSLYAAIGSTVLVGAALAWMAISSPTGFPGLSAAGLGVGVLVAAVVALTDGRRLLRGALLCALVLAFSSWWIPSVSARDRDVRSAAAGRFGSELSRAVQASPGKPASGSWFDLERPAYLAVRLDELKAGRTCSKRRFVTLVRFNEPLVFESEGLSSEVYYGGRDVETTRTWSRPIGSCEYVVTTRDLQTTEKGRALVAVLAPGGVREVGESGGFLVLEALGGAASSRGLSRGR